MKAAIKLLIVGVALLVILPVTFIIEMIGTGFNSMQVTYAVIDKARTLLK